MSLPVTPRRGKNDFQRVLRDLNLKFNLDLPIESMPQTPSSRMKRDQGLVPDCLALLKWAYWNVAVDLDKVILNFEEWTKHLASDWVHKPNQVPGTIPPRSSTFLHTTKTSTFSAVTAPEREKMLKHLFTLLKEEKYLVQERDSLMGSPQRPRNRLSEVEKTSEPVSKLGILTPSSNGDARQKRRNEGVQEVFATAPNSPTPSPDSATASINDEFGGFDADDIESSLLDSADENAQSPTPKKQRQSNIGDFFPVTKRADEKSLEPDKSALITSFSTVMTKSTSFDTETAATSFSSDIGNESTDPFSQYSDIFEDEEALLHVAKISGQVPHPPVASAPAVNASSEKLYGIIQELEETGPFSRNSERLSTIPLRYRYEAERVALSQKVPVEAIVPERPTMPLDYNEFWKSLQKDSACFVEKSKPGPWKMAIDKFNGPDDTVITLSGQLDWLGPSEKGIFSLNLNPLKFERGYRLCRRFGSDRFLEVTFPSLSRYPGYLKSRADPTTLHKAITTWFANSKHYLLGRVWRAFFIEDVKKKSSKKEGMKCRICLFAIDGSDFHSRFRAPLDSLYVSPHSEDSGSRTPMDIEGFFNWHIPWEHNKGQKQCKLFNRMSLGLSRTLPTVIIQPDEFIFLPDPKGTVMNDGCAMMSMSLGCEIAERLGLDNMPSCFQGRIAGAKGMWMVHRNDDMYKKGSRKFWIQITESQLKILPPPGANQVVHFDDDQLTFEVVSWSRPLRPVQLNTQLLAVLQKGGVSETHIVDLVRREIKAEYDELQEVISHRNTALCLNQARSMRGPDENLRVKGREVKARDFDGFPSEDVEQATLLLENGFLPLQLPFLTDIFKSLLDYRFKSLEKLKIRVPLSTYAYCIADPYSVLEANEVHMGFSQPWKERGYRDDLDGIDVLVARLPAHLPSDVQKRRAVFKTELRHFKDVIVFSTKGDIPLASELSGGDYDGDETWICWDPSFVNNFTNTPFKPDSLPPAESLGLIDLSRRVCEFPSFDSFLADVFAFYALPSKLGHCTIAYECHCYYSADISSNASMKFAALLGYLVDSRKAGLQLTSEKWKEFQEVNGIVRGEEPLYKRESTENVDDWNKTSILDHLKFGVINGEKQRYRQSFKKFCDEETTFSVDADLTDKWRTLMNQAHKEEKNGSGRTLLNSLNHIINGIEDAHEKWLFFQNGKPRSIAIMSAADYLEKVEPPVFDHNLSTVWRENPVEWAKVRASRAYFKQPKGKFPWYAAGKVLCEIKSRTIGPIRTMTAEAHQAYRIDRRVIKRIKEQLKRGEDDYAEDEDEEDEFGDDVFADADPAIFESFDNAGFESDDDWVSLA